MADDEDAAHHSVASCRKEPRGSGGSLEEGRDLEVKRF